MGSASICPDPPFLSPCSPRGYVKPPTSLKGRQPLLQGPPPDGTAVPCGCGSTGRRLHSHTCRDLPTHPHVLRSDMETTWSNEKVGQMDAGGEIRIWGCQLDACLGPLSGVPASQGQMLGSAALAQLGSITKDIVSLPQPGPPTSTVQPEGSGAIATTTLSTPWLGPNSYPSGSELKGSQRESDPRSSSHARGGSWQLPSCSHPDYLPPPLPGTWAVL